jgi:hypothetical protein
MTHKLRILGLALAAIFVLSASGASGAAAVLLHSNSTSGTTHITGIQIGTNQIDLANGTPYKCAIVIFAATYTGTTASELTLATALDSCTTAGQKAEIKPNGCVDKITTPVAAEPKDGDHFTATVHLVCPAGKEVELLNPTAGCSVTMPPQTLGVVDLTNITTSTANQDDTLLKWTAKYKYTTVGGGFCGAAGIGSFTGEVTLRAYADAAHSVQRDLAIF